MRTFIPILFVMFVAACTTVPYEPVDRRTYAPPPGGTWSDPLASPPPIAVTTHRVVREGYGDALELTYEFRQRRNARGAALEAGRCTLLVKEEGSRSSERVRCNVIFIANQARVEYRDRTTRIDRVISIDGPQSPFFCDRSHPRPRRSQIGGIANLEYGSTPSRYWQVRSCTTNGTL